MPLNNLPKNDKLAGIADSEVKERNSYMTGKVMSVRTPVAMPMLE